MLKILWAVDGSESSLAAAPLIRNLLLPVAASIRVLIVTPRPLLSGARPDPVYFKPASAAERQQQDQLAERTAQLAASQLPAGTPVEIIIKRGHPIREIAAAADRERADLVVMGARGQSNLKLMLLGSVSQGVLDYSDVPLLLVRPNGGNVDTVVAGVDGSRESRKALDFAMSLSLAQDATIVLTRVIQPILIRHGAGASTRRVLDQEVQSLNEAMAVEAAQDLAAARRQLSGRPLRIEEAVRSGKPGQQLVEAVSEGGADLLVLGSRKPSRARKYLVGSTAEFAARESPSSVLIVR